MTLYYTIVFLVLVLEMFLFLILVAPVPLQVHKKLIQALRSPTMTKVMRSIKFLFFFILVLFVDSVQRVWNVPELEALGTGQLTVADRSDYQARKFYNQRNMYLCGFTLFLSLILNRTFTLVKSNSDLRSQLGDGEHSLKTEDLKERLERKKKQLKAMEAQSESLQKEYYRVCDELNEAKGKARTQKAD